MKLFITTVIALFVFAGVATAQHANLGIKGGLNVYTINNSDNSKADPKIGFHLGLLGHIHIANQFALQPEINYSLQGAKSTAAGNEMKLNLHYINVPVLLQYMFDNGFRLQAGPQLGFLASANSELQNTDTDVKDNYETVEFGLGVGVSYVNPKSNIGFDIRYNHGLSNINKNGNANNYNRGLQAGVFFLINHK